VVLYACLRTVVDEARGSSIQRGGGGTGCRSRVGGKVTLPASVGRRRGVAGSGCAAWGKRGSRLKTDAHDACPLL
jgi:hypothetical protein